MVCSPFKMVQKVVQKMVQKIVQSIFYPMSIYDSLITRKDRLSDRFTVAVKYRKYSLCDFLQGT